MGKFKIVFSFITGILAFVFGGFDVLLKTLIVFITMEYITGVFSAIKSKELPSAAGYKGIISKITILFIVAVSYGLDNVFNISILRKLTICFYIINEAVSIIGNTARIGVSYPKKLLDTLERLKDKKE